MRGSFPVLASLVYEIWQWSRERSPSQHNTFLAFTTMRQTGNPGWTDSSDWKLDQIVFARLNDLWGPLEVDLFARRLTNQLPSYVSWRPDPEAEATDALSGLVSDLGLHIPPFQSGRSLPIPSAGTGYPVSVSRSPSMGDAALVSSTVISECRFSTPLPNRPKGSKQGGITSPSPQASTSKGGLSQPILHCNGNFKPGSGTPCFRL